jgi:hypothetical protein
MNLMAMTNDIAVPDWTICPLCNLEIQATGQNKQSLPLHLSANMRLVFSFGIGKTAVLI